MALILLAVVVLAWGFSWYAITLQVSEASALLSLTYRFILAASLMCCGLIITGKWRAIPLREQPWLFALGFCLFSMNFLCFYLAAHYITSGVLSVVFATAAIFGALNARVFLNSRLEVRTLFAAALGILGLYLILRREIESIDSQTTVWWALVLPFLGTYFFSLGNLISARLSRTYSLPNVVGQGMIWGAVLLTVVCLTTGEPWLIPRSTLFWSGVVYLAVVSSLLAFLAYLAFVNRFGTARASYATVLFPILAMIVSTSEEGYEWTIVAAAGLAMALGGTFLIFSRK